MKRIAFACAGAAMLLATPVVADPLSDSMIEGSNACISYLVGKESSAIVQLINAGFVLDKATDRYKRTIDSDHSVTFDYSKADDSCFIGLEFPSTPKARADVLAQVGVYTGQLGMTAAQSRVVATEKDAPSEGPFLRSSWILPGKIAVELNEYKKPWLSPLTLTLVTDELAVGRVH